MLYKIVKNIVGGTDVDFSDYVTSIDKVPYWTKNRDYSLIAEGYSFKLSNQCPVSIGSGDRILFYRDTQIIHIGIVDSVNLDEKTLLYRVEVNHILSELQKRNTGESRREDGVGGYKSFLTLMQEHKTTKLVGDVEYDFIDYKSLVDLIVSETEAETLSIDWSNTNFFQSFNVTWKSIKAGDTTLTEVNSPSANETTVWFLPEQINCININGVYADSEIIGEIAANRSTLFDLLSVLCTLFGLSFIVKDATTLYAVNTRSAVGNYFEDDDLYEIKTQEEIINATGFEVNYSTLNYLYWFIDSFLSIPNFDPNGIYYEGDYVLYQGNYWRAIKDTPEGVPGDNGSGGSDWYQLTSSINNKYYIVPGYGAVDSAFVDYKYSIGVKAEYGDYADNFNPIIFDGTDAYICIPQVIDSYTTVKFQKQAKMNSFTKIDLTTKASLIIGTTLYEYESVYVDDINTDTVEVELVL